MPVGFERLTIRSRLPRTGEILFAVSGIKHVGDRRRR